MTGYAARKLRQTKILQQVQVKEEEVVASLCRESYSSFVREFWHSCVSEKLKWNWHMEVMCDEAQAAAERVLMGLPRLHDLATNVSPGTSKSLIFSVFLMPWMWSRMPSAKGIFVSYAEDLAFDLSRKSRDVVTSEWYRKCFPDIRLRRDQAGKGYFMNDKGGWRFCGGTQGNITGMHAHVIVIDDPINPNAAVSEKELGTAARIMRQTLPSRKVDKQVSVTMLVMQRLALGDPTDVMMDMGVTRHVCLPAEIYTSGREQTEDMPTEAALTERVKPRSVLPYYQNGLMDPLRLNHKALWAMQQALGTQGYAGQFLQLPVVEGGSLFRTDNLKYFMHAPRKLVRAVRGWDKGGTGGGGAYTAGVLVGKDTYGKFWVLDVIRGQWDSAKREDVILRTAKADGGNVVVALEQEGGSGGKESAENTVRRLAGFVVKVQTVGKSTGDKTNKADAFSVQVNAGNVHLVKAPWNHAYSDELKYFPNGKYKDQVDASSLAFAHVHRTKIRIGGSEPSREWLEQLLSV